MTGGHSAKIGFTAVFGTTDVVYYDPFENILYRVINGKTNATPNRVTYYGLPTRARDYLRPNLGIFAQDQWTIKRMTLNAGLRFDYHAHRLSRSRHSSHAVRAGTPRVRGRGRHPLDQPLATRRRELRPVRHGEDGSEVQRQPLRAGRRPAEPPPGQPGRAEQQHEPDLERRNRNFIVEGDPFNPATNGELGPSDNANFGLAVRNTFYDEAWAKGYNTRPYNWEMSAGVQHELLPRVAVNGSYFRRMYGNFEMIGQPRRRRRRLRSVLRHRVRPTHGCRAAAASESAASSISSARRSGR